MDRASLAARQPTLPRIVAIAITICAALEHAHNNSIVHRDLKPDNVCCRARRLEQREARRSRTRLTSLRRTHLARRHHCRHRAYMAPEQALGQTVDGRADLYALGVLLYELTTGRVPFTGDDPLTSFRNTCTRRLCRRACFVPICRRARNDHRSAARERSGATIQLGGRNPRSAARLALIETGRSHSNRGAPAVAILDALVARTSRRSRNAELAEARELWQRAREGRGHACC